MDRNYYRFLLRSRERNFEYAAIASLLLRELKESVPSDVSRAQNQSGLIDQK